MTHKETVEYMQSWFIDMIDRRISKCVGETDFADGWRSALLNLRSVFDEHNEYDEAIAKMVDSVAASQNQGEWV